MAGLSSFLNALFRFLPRRLVKHYIVPLTKAGPTAPYNAGRYFESYYRSTLGREFSDGITISPSYNPFLARFHYNTVENAIIRYFSLRPLPESPRVLDVGSGAGHWIDFFLDLFKADSVVGVEISGSCADALRRKYQGRAQVSIMEADVRAADFNLSGKFDLISAIGVMFHMVDDEGWERAVKNLAALLRDDGVMIVSGQFGLITQNVQFHAIDDFENWGEAAPSQPPATLLVDKKIRSLRRWRSCALRSGLEIDRLQRSPWPTKWAGPENNLIFLKHRK